MALTEFIVTGISVTTAQLPKTVTFASLTPLDGTLPTFTVAPLVSVLSTNSDSYLDAKNVTTASFQLVGALIGSDTSFTVAVRIITQEPVSASPSTASAVSYPYYCSVQDVKEALSQLQSGSGKKFDAPMRTRQISRAYSEINAALREGGYEAPVTNTTKQVISEALTASDNIVSFTLPDGSDYSIGDTVRIHGKSGNTYNDEFSPILMINTNVLSVYNLESSYNADSTCELCTDAFLWLREVNIMGTDPKALDTLVFGQGSFKNEKIEGGKTEYQRRLDEIRKGTVWLDGFTRRTVMRTYQDDNSGDSDVAAVFAVDELF